MLCAVGAILLVVILAIVAVSLAQTAAILNSVGLSVPQSTKKLDTIIRQGVHVAGELDLLQQEVAENAQVVDSAVLLLTMLKQKLDDAIASGDMAQVAALAQELSNKTDALATAVAANTPAES